VLARDPPPRAAISPRGGEFDCLPRGPAHVDAFAPPELTHISRRGFFLHANPGIGLVQHVFFPVETFNREFDYRIVLAALLARPGRRFFIGQHDTIARLAQQTRGGLYVGKNVFRSLFPTDLALYDSLRGNGLSLLHLDEEGAVFPGGPDSWRRSLDQRLDPRVLHDSDTVCTWGEFQAEHYRGRAPQLASRIHVTGHPRFDLYKPAWSSYFDGERDALTARFGRFLLLNSNLANVNSAFGDRAMFEHFYLRRGQTPEGLALDIERWARSSHLFGAFVAAVFHLATAQPGRTIVVRPHPAESPDRWRAAFLGLPNVHVLHEGPAYAWVIAADIVVHESCTTGFEAWLAGTPTCVFRPTAADGQGSPVPNSFGRICATERSLVNALEAIDSGTTGVGHERRQVAQTDALLYNLRGDSMARFVDAFEQASASATTTAQAPDRKTMRVSAARDDASMAARAIARRIVPGREQAFRGFQQAFPGFDRADVARRAHAASRIAGRAIDVDYVSSRLLVVEPR
jgi:surface carbohydrate biosynthesis protein